jgi:hypothetical protein
VLWEAVEGRVLIYTHKEQMLDEVEKRYPASRYVNPASIRSLKTHGGGWLLGAAGIGQLGSAKLAP